MVQRDNNFNEKATTRVRQNGFTEMLDGLYIQRPSGINMEDSRELVNHGV